MFSRVGLSQICRHGAAGGAVRPAFYFLFSPQYNCGLDVEIRWRFDI